MTCKSSSRGAVLQPLVWHVYSFLDGLDVIELWGDDGLDAWFEALGSLRG